ncbi:hypothetical protein D6855_12440 [Butyrivibrio sp. CB08]|uniref:hypothetical protein n=1 Tax=Butyrivibrio sp. CB08 TaxID=2364879 RepID=UPI000EA8432F|nr:hypothetical protein [Butyrivibrio sp. CB08]RKM57852.1 hypothetical protein D6855_12440 [Butyrivibrio sp. CB08]
MTSVEKKIVDFIVKYFWVIVILVGLFGGLAARSKGWYMVSPDYDGYLYPWMDTLDQNTGLKGLAIDHLGTYYIPYMTVLALITYLDPSKWLGAVKAISVISEMLFAVGAALIAWKLLKESGKNPKWAAAVFALFMLSPEIVMNGAFWGQCDYIYAAFIMFCAYFMLCEKYTLAMNMFGIAFIFKQQALMVLPVLALVYLCNKKFSILKFLYIPMWYLIGGLPAIIAGRPAASVYRIYLNQANEFGQLSMNLMNIYRFFPNLAKDDFFTWGMVTTAVILFMLALWLFERGYKLNNQIILGLFLVSTGVCGMFLPALHERYIALYTGFLFLYYMIFSKKKVVLAGIVETLVCVTYFYSLYGINRVDQYHWAAATNLLILFYVIYDVTQTIKRANNS